MSKLLIFLGFFFLSPNGFGQVQIQMFIQGTRDSVHFEPIENVQLYSRFPRNYEEYRYFDNDDSNEYWIYWEDSSVFNRHFHFHHPAYTFPTQRLIDFPYEIQHDHITFTITGIPKPKVVRHFIKIPAATDDKQTEGTITLRYLAFDTKDSIVLVNERGKHLASFDAPGENGIHTLANFAPKKPQFYYSIINLSHPDTAKVNPWNWMNVIPQIELKPVQRAESEVETLQEHFRYLNEMRTQHQAQVSELKQEISHLKDSIADILYPKRRNWPLGGPINVPSKGIIDGVFIKNDSLRRDPTKDPTFKEEIIALVQKENPEKTGKIYLEVNVNHYGRAQATLLSHSEEFKYIEQSLKLHLEIFNWNPTAFVNDALDTTHLFELVISEK